MATKTFELVEGPSWTLRVHLPRKIKFKSISFKNISARWNEFRLNRLKSQLISKKTKLVNMEFKNEQVTGEKREKTATRVLGKTKAIAKLESKIRFLETGSYSTEEFIDSRAIKLKNLMMNNLVYNRNSLYSVTDPVAEQIMTGTIVESENVAINPTTPTNVEPTEDSIAKQQEEIAANVRRIMEEQAARKKTVVQPKARKTIPSTVVREDEVSAAIKEAMSGIVVERPVVPKTEAQTSEKFKVSNNESSPAKVNKFINDDGTYMLKKEDIDEEFRITRFDRSKLPGKPTHETSLNIDEELDIPPFDLKIRREMPVLEAKKAITPFSVNQVVLAQKSIPSITDLIATSEYKDPSIAIEEEDTSVKKPSIINVAINPDIQALFAKAEILRREEERIESEKAAMATTSREVEKNYEDTLGKFIAYCQGLETRCNDSQTDLEEQRSRSKTKQEQIDMMIAYMEQGIPTSLVPVEPSKNRGTRGK